MKRIIDALWTCLVILVYCNISQGGNDVTTSAEIYYIHITSEVTYRFASTTVNSLLANPGTTDKEITFKMVLPNSAFITNFSMVIDGELINGEVKEKQKAKMDYERAKAKGQSAGIVRERRETNSFQISVNVAALKKVNCTLVYQQLLYRRLGMYQNAIFISPGSIVPDLRVDVFIRESRKITKIKVPEIKRDLLENKSEQKVNSIAVINREGLDSAHISYYPSVQQQKDFSESGINGQFIVEYDLVRDLDAGDIEVIDGYFVHYFAPSGLGALNKNVVFVLDRSGSMSGIKLKQLKRAMTRILNDLKTGDQFNIITFSDTAQYWVKDTMLKATRENIEKAKTFVNKIRASGGTHIDNALADAIGFLDNNNRNEKIDKATAQLIFLTDGEPTSGETNTVKIIENVKRSNVILDVPIFGLAFGSGADYQFLQQLSARNKGVARRIYEGSDADIQLEGFYEEISTPLLSNVSMNYHGDAVDKTTLTKTYFRNYFDGSEIIVAGKLNDVALEDLSVTVTAKSISGEVGLQATARQGQLNEKRVEFVKFTERLWAYLTIKSLLDKKLATENVTVKTLYQNEALDLSLKYSFVTPLTSMVVVKPDALENIEGDTERAPSSSAPIAPRVNRKRKYNHQSGRSSFADSDPHFVVPIHGIDNPVCFDVNGDPGDIFQLLYDKDLGVIVNGQVEASGQKSKLGKYQTYFTKIAIVRNRFKIVVRPTSVTLNNDKIKWKKHPTEIIKHKYRVLMTRKNVTVVFNNNLRLVVVRHLAHKHNPSKINFLGFYISSESTMSRRVHGLIGQFENQKFKIKVSGSGSKTTGKLKFLPPRQYKKSVPVHLIRRRNLATHEFVNCWHVRNNGHLLLDGTWRDYRVQKLTYEGFPYKLFKTLPKYVYVV